MSEINFVHLAHSTVLSLKFLLHAKKSNLAYPTKRKDTANAECLKYVIQINQNSQARNSNNKREIEEKPKIKKINKRMCILLKSNRMKKLFYKSTKMERL